MDKPTKNCENCKNCKYWDDHGDEENAKPRMGNCCRFPPRHNGETNAQGLLPMHQSWEFPVTGGNWWCGEFNNRKV